jgi:drug/metabolite transporter (DMT)-like permease
MKQSFKSRQSFHSFGVSDSTQVRLHSDKTSPLINTLKEDFASLKEMNEKQDNSELPWLIIFRLVSSVSFCLATVICKYIMINYGLQNDTISIYRGVVSVILGIYYTRILDIDMIQQLKEHRHAIGHLTMRIAASVIGSSMMVESLNYIKSSSTLTIFQMYPLVVVLMNVVAGKDRLTIFDGSGFSLCILGVVLICKPAFLFNSVSNEQPVGYLLDIIGTTLFSYSIYLNAIVNKYFHPLVSVAGLGCGYLVQYFFMITLQNYSREENELYNKEYLFAILLLFLQGIFFFYTMYYFIRSIGTRVSKIVMLISYVTIIFSFFLDMIVFGIGIGFLDILGIILILSVSVFVVFFR